MANPDELVWALNLVNGQVARIQRHVLEHPTFSVNQVEVEPFTESYDSATWVAKTRDEYLAWVDTDAAWNAPHKVSIQADDHNTIFGIVADA